MEIVGRNSTLIQVPFLNALANLRARAGQGAAIRVGGNSQESSLMFGENGFGNFRAINKTKDRTTDNPVCLFLAAFPRTKLTLDLTK
jgi:hypothetical protein